MGRAAAILAVAALLAGAGAKAEPAGLEPVAFAGLDGWSTDGQSEAFLAFSKSCRAILDDLPPSRPALPPGDALKRVCAEAAGLGPLSDADARAFFERAFRPFRVGNGLLTGYYEPEIEGSLTRTARFDTPLLGRPDDLVTLAEGETAPGVPAGLQGARRTASGLEPYYDRPAIEDGALDGRGLELVWAERVDAFFVHIQGSTRVRLPDGSRIRLAYAGRNGRKFTGIGRLMVERGHLSKSSTTMASMREWLARNPEEGRALMRENASYIFFRIDRSLKDSDGPLGAQNVPLIPGRSIAVDRTIWSYGLPFWIDGRLPDGARLNRLVVAQDTGSAILGAARGDYFAGTGDAAGALAGGMKQRTDFVVLLPKDAGPR